MAEPGGASVPSQWFLLLRRGVQPVQESLMDLGQSGSGHGLSIGTGCDVFPLLLHQPTLPWGEICNYTVARCAQLGVWRCKSVLLVRNPVHNPTNSGQNLSISSRGLHAGNSWWHCCSRSPRSTCRRSLIRKERAEEVRGASQEDRITSAARGVRSARRHGEGCGVPAVIR